MVKSKKYEIRWNTWPPATQMGFIYVFLFQNNKNRISSTKYKKVNQIVVDNITGKYCHFANRQENSTNILDVTSVGRKWDGHKLGSGCVCVLQVVYELKKWLDCYGNCGCYITWI